MPTSLSQDDDARRVHEGFDLLRVPAVRRLITWKGFPRLLQWLTLTAFVALAALSWGVFAPSGANAKLFAKSHVTTLIIWGVWWPSMVWFAVLFGRVWCMVCPLELVSDLGEQFAKRFRLPRRPLPSWIAAGTVIVALYATIQMLVAGAHINRVPAYTSFFLLALFGTALGTVIVFRDRAFCRGFCPVGLLLGTYGRGGMVAVRPTPTSADIPAGPNAQTCPSLLNPSKLDSNANCLVCCRCIKAAAPGTMRLMLRRPFATSDRRAPVASWPVTIFVMLVSGFVTWELTTEWSAAEEVFLFVPTWMVGEINSPAALGWSEGIWALFIVPFCVWSTLGAVMRLLGRKEALGDLWRRIALPIAVVVSAGHMSKGLAKFVSWAPFLPRALREPGGIHPGALAPPAPAGWLPHFAVAIFCLGLITAAVIYGIREERLASPADSKRWQTAAPLVVVGLLFGSIVSGWIWS